MTFNIRFENERDAEHSWNNRRPILSKIINSFKPDFLATQEGRRPQILDLDQRLDNLALSDTHRNWIEERMYPNLFYNPDRFQVNQSGDIWLSQTPNVPGSKSFDSAFPRLCTWSVFKSLSSPSNSIVVIGTHLDHLKSYTRESQIKILIQEITKLNLHQYPIILMGDFNDHPKSLVRESLIDSVELGLTDPWIDLGLQEAPSHHKFDGCQKDGDRIDWILHSKKFRAEKIYMDTNSENGIYPSDHFPVLANLELLT